MEPRFGHNFSGVRVYTDANAASSARQLSARAYTVGQNIVLDTNQFEPTTVAGKKLLAHELTHVVQQSAAGLIGIQRQTTEEDKKKFESSNTAAANIALIKSEWDAQGDKNNHKLAYILATVEHESGFHSRSEVKQVKDNTEGQRELIARQSKYWNTGFFGRGFVQLTWKGNYEKMSIVTGVDLVKEPDRALDPRIAAKITVYGMVHGTFTGKSLSDYFTDHTNNNKGARRIINAQDKAEEIAEKAEAHYARLTSTDGGKAYYQSFMNLFDVQQVLKAEGFLKGAVDGRGGAKTNQAIKAFKVKNNLSEPTSPNLDDKTKAKLLEMQTARIGTTSSATTETTPAANPSSVAASGAVCPVKIGAPTGHGKVSATLLNVRKGPGANHDKTSTALQKGTSVTIYGRANGWLCIGDGQWVSGDFVSIATKEPVEVKKERQDKAHSLLSMYATFLPYTSIYINLDENGLARLLAIYAKFDDKLVLEVFDLLDDSDTDDVAFEMVHRASSADLAKFDHHVLARLRRAMAGWGQTPAETQQIDRINHTFGKGADGLEKETIGEPKPDASEPVKGGGSGGRQKPDIVFFRGIDVARSIEPNLKAMVIAAEKDGITLEGGGARTYEEQVALRRQNCGPTHYDIYEKPSRLCKPETAIPGRSMHEKGLAFDFRRNKKRITKSSPEYNWLVENAERFGFYNLPSESWHWSTNGK
jgi:predicted chitinase